VSETSRARKTRLEARSVLLVREDFKPMADTAIRSLSRFSKEEMIEDV